MQNSRLRHRPFAVSSRWFEGSCQITSYELDELLGTKLRALYASMFLDLILTKQPTDEFGNKIIKLERPAGFPAETFPLLLGVKEQYSC